MTGGYVEKSFAPAPADLEAIGAFTRRAFAPEELYVFSVVLCCQPKLEAMYYVAE